MRWRAASALAMVVVMTSATIASALAPAPFKAVPREAMAPLVVLPARAAPALPDPAHRSAASMGNVVMDGDGLQAMPLPRMDDRSGLAPSPERRTVVATQSARGGPAARGGTLVGVASWYCNKDARRGPISRCTVNHPSGLYAAIRRDLLSHRGDRAEVCRGTRCVVVTIIDCNCGASANLIDLYGDAFVKLAPLGTGRVRVTLRWL